MIDKGTGTVPKGTVPVSEGACPLGLSPDLK